MNGFVIAPTNDRIAFLQDVKYRKTTAETYPGLPLANARLYNDLMYRHWKTWDDGHDSNVFTVELKNGMLVGEPVNIVNEPFEAPVEPNDGIEQVSFSPDGKMIAYSCKKYSGKEYALNTNTDIFYTTFKQNLPATSVDSIQVMINPLYSLLTATRFCGMPC